MPELRKKLRLLAAGLVLFPLYPAASSEAFGSSPLVSNLLLMMVILLIALVIPGQREEILVTVRKATSKENSRRHWQRYQQRKKSPFFHSILKLQHKHSSYSLVCNCSQSSLELGVCIAYCEKVIHQAKLGPQARTQLSQKPMLFRWSPSMHISQDGFRQPMSILYFL